MLDHAWNWAKENSQWRKNPIHGEEEINIVIEDFFQHVEQQGTSMQQTGDFEMEDSFDGFSYQEQFKYIACS